MATYPTVNGLLSFTKPTQRPTAFDPLAGSGTTKPPTSPAPSPTGIQPFQPFQFPGAPSSPFKAAPIAPAPTSRTLGQVSGLFTRPESTTPTDLLGGAKPYDPTKDAKVVQQPLVPGQADVPAPAAPSLAVKPVKTGETTVAAPPVTPPDRVVKPITTGQADAPPTSTTPTPPSMPSPDADLESLRTFAKNLMDTKDDPVLRRQWNTMLIQQGLNNNAAMTALQMRINQDPSLRGQPAGFAFMQELARDQGFTTDQLAGQLSVESAKRIQDLNQYGFEQLGKITEYRQNRDDAARQELLKAGDFDGYAAAFKKSTGLDVDVSSLKELSPATQGAIDTQLGLMNKALAAGNVDAARKYFDTIVQLAPHAFAGASFDDLGLGTDAYLMHNQTRTDLETAIRKNITTGQLGDALAGIDQLYKPDEQKTKGSSLIQASDLATINRFLQAGGYAPVTDKSELIGREQDVFRGQYIAGIQKEAGSSVVDKMVDTLQGELQKNGFDTTNPDAARAIRSYALNLQLNGGLTFDADGNPKIDPNSLIPPWDPKSTDAYLFSDWPVLDGNGQIIDPGGDPYGDRNPRPAPNTARGDYYDGLDKKWEDYLLKTPTAGRLTRDQWFYATKAGTQDVNKADIPAGVGGGAGTPVVSDEDRNDPLKRDAFINSFKNDFTQEQLAEKMKDPDFLAKAIAYKALPNYNSSGSIPATQAEWDAIGKDGGYFSIDGKAYKIERNAFNKDYLMRVTRGHIADGRLYIQDNREIGNAGLGYAPSGGEANLMRIVDSTGKELTMIVTGTLGAYGPGTIFDQSKPDAPIVYQMK